MARAWLVRFILILLTIFPITHAAAAPEEAPQLWLPTPPGEEWRIIQGYACGTHNAWDRYSLDLVSVEGRTRGAAVRAAADGEVFIWVPRSGTLILRHRGGLYTMYTHMESAAITEAGRVIARGEVIGATGDRGSPGTPHLHFTAFVADGAWARNRRSVPLSFAEGYTLPEIGGCNQHGGMVVVAGGPAAPSADTTPPALAAPAMEYRVPPEFPSTITWPPATDDASGIAGYRLYIGDDPHGTSAWFVEAAAVQTPPLAPGSYLLRVQPIDGARNEGAWVTIGSIIVAQ
jgi:murein DD-endopeptidase MepM/ murein hydrolase activator NlpD